MFSERSERTSPTVHALGDESVRAEIGSQNGIATDRVVIAPSRAAALHALLYVLADLGHEVLVTGDALAIDVAAVAGLDATLVELEGEALFEAAGERTRAIVVERVEPEILELLAEIALPILTRDASIVTHSIFASENAPLAVVLGDTWLAVLGPEDRAGPLLARLSWHAHVFLASA